MLTCEIDRTSPITVVAVDGDLRLGTVSQVRAALLKCLAECPDAVLVDLSRTVIGAPVALTVFAAVSRRAAVWPPVPLVLAARPPGVRQQLATVSRAWGLPVHESVEAALSAAPFGPPPVRRVERRLRPGTMALPQARTLVADACTEWGLGDFTMPAELIMSELASNAVQHAGTDLTVAVILRRGLLHLTVADGNPDPPQKPRDFPSVGALTGRGLMLVEEFATAWGHLPIDAGKVVWATLRVSG
ncbi:ATP-binding protein [Cryptosporangium phraense]|uniref:ATP-binding protein n=1 Tax=Cryptosporangium phraense TaxID=2593070 RepID=A0A545ALJ3_9ACTN|nr:ATP-binding protein [Cryptosporangium phraense]TQS42194.1 ATP-binding protein [Cryptosporangium phraense]